MIRQDYFLRLLEEFATALATMMKKKEDERDDSLKDLYRQYVGDYTLLRNMSVDELIAYAANEWDDNGSRASVCRRQLQSKPLAQHVARKSLSAVCIRRRKAKRLLD